MRHMRLVIGLTLVLLACHPRVAGFDAGVPSDGGSAFASFSLLDVNANSSSSGQQVTPVQYAGKVTAWYFGHSS